MQCAACARIDSRVRYLAIGAAEALPDGVFDVVAMIDVLHHIRPGGNASGLSAAAAKVRPGGLLVFKDMGRRPYWRALANRLHDLVVAREWIHYCPITSVEEWARDSGFDISLRDDRDMFWYRHELCVFRRRNGPII